ncbi:MAG: hypothetical protein Q8R04_07695, partial [Nanoarchaeota archaeon]|nr:hypothetical protein [Nanoarchaeota archaeon]
PLEGINKMLSNHENFFVQGLTTETFDSAYALISKMGPIEFLNTYNQACDQFGIDYHNRVLWWKLFVQFKKAAAILYEKERIKKLVKKGYRP